MNWSTRARPMDGIIVVDKPEGWTSHDVVNKLRRIAQTRKIGHLGTLDPFATGVLPLVINRATRLAQFYVHSEKVYDARVRFGYSTDTYDREGTATSPPSDPEISAGVLDERLNAFRGEYLVTPPPRPPPRGPEISAGVLDERLNAFRGEYLLTPPPVSAKKIGGVPAYRFARQQIEVTLKPVPVHVYELKLLEVEGSEAHLWTRCSAGTYMRSIAHELGRALSCGAHLKELRRLRSGEFTIEQARTTEPPQSTAGEG